MDYSKLETIVVTPMSGGVFHVELNRPVQRNSWNHDMWVECRSVFQALANESECRSIVLSGRGKSFSAGLDLQDPRNMTPAHEDVARKAVRFIDHAKLMQDAFSAIELCLKPTIAVIHGACVGAGVDLIVATDIRICTQDAFFCVKEVAVGLAADVGTLARLPKIVGSDSFVRDLALTARDCMADEAKAHGLVSKILPSKDDAVAEAAKMATVIAAHSPIAIVGTKKNLNFARDHTVQDSLDYVLTWNSAMIQGEDLMKAMMSAMQKKKPEFSKL
eukprot:TRINITY_DN24562_c0_g1_i1.p1 TRINITY_DN24562_c0_g1~~TRINITY_DN24562_c0_g1_i1.p1  ORF type:complete len:275 (-),score=47.83 TRINITY_DN24562_c0_g1_i1:89-913(-)